MRPVILYVTTSLDGLIAGPEGEIDWLFHDQDYGYAAFYDSIDCCIMGSKTYQLIEKFGDYPYPGKPSYVFTRQQRQSPHEEVRFVQGDPAKLIEELRNQEGTRQGSDGIWLIGGGDLVRQCLGLIDEFHLYVHPLILGAGIPLFPQGTPPLDLELIGTEAYSSGMVRLSYRPKKP